jgi:hypothetical protein
MRNKIRVFDDAMEFGDKRKPRQKRQVKTRHHRRRRVIHVKHRMTF